VGKTVNIKGNVGLGVALNTIAPINTMSTIAPINTSSSVALNAGLDDIRIATQPIQTTSSVDAGLDNIRLNNVAPITTSSTLNAQVDLGLDDIRIRELAPVRIELSFKAFRFHLPLNYQFNIDLFGVPVFRFSLCGEGMAIGEDYVPKDTERC
jgi:hypothetical protein